MRFHVQSIDRPNDVSEALRGRLTDLGYRIGKRGADHLVARIYGYRDWKDMLANLGVCQPDLFDDVTDPLIVASRRAFHVAALVKWGVKPDHAAGLVDEIGPTSNRETGMPSP